MIIFLHGSDTFRSRQKISELKTKFINEVDSSGLNITHLSGNINPEELETGLRAAAFLAPKRMLIVEGLLTQKISKQFEKRMLEILKSLGDAVIAVFWEEQLDKTKMKSLLYKNLITEKFAIGFAPLSGARLRNWYEAELQKQDANITRPALQRLVDMVGDDLWQANAEIAKLAAYCRGRTIEIEDVEEISYSSVEESIFLLTDALGQKNKRLALRLIEGQLRSGVNATELLNTLVWQFKNLLMAKSLQQEGVTAAGSAAVSKQLKLHPFVAKKILGQINNFKLAELRRHYKRLLEIDLQIKTSQAAPEALFGLFVLSQ